MDGTIRIWMELLEDGWTIAIWMNYWNMDELLQNG